MFLSEMVEVNKCTFFYVPPNSDKPVEIEISNPFEKDAEELAYTLIIRYKLGIYEVKELTRQLQQFIDAYTNELYNQDVEALITSAKNASLDLEEITKDWERIMREETADYGEKRCASDEELFATAYHKMVHSPALETMLQLEHMYAQTVRQRTEEKDLMIKKLADRQTEEMNKAVDRLEEDMTESKINQLVARHYEDHSLLIVKLTSEIDTIKEVQRREYREWLMQMLEQNQATNSLPTPKNSPLAPMPPEPMGISNTTAPLERTVLEESFTIHLGSQLKQMHNIRILSANVMDLCAVSESEILSEPTPQLLQTALSLYSNDLYGLVLTTDNKIGSRYTQEFQETCRRTTEFHFSHIDDQLEKITQNVRKRNSHSELLQPGDFYMTKHSNLSQAHVIFHMVADESLKAGNITSRHPVVLGLRNILKTACSNDVTSLTIPLLLQYEMGEEMTISWCEKRAELIFKCVKGFMIEMASWGGSDLKNLQFMLPQGISSEVFQSLTEMLPRIFKVSNPKILK